VINEDEIERMRLNMVEGVRAWRNAQSKQIEEIRTSTIAHDITILIPGQPIGKGRPRFGKGRTYTPAKTETWTTRAVRIIRERVKERAIASAVIVDWVAVFDRPKRMIAKKWPNRRELHTVKPDRDNVDKAILDALVKAGVLKDDCKVTDGHLCKRYADKVESAHVLITIKHIIP
jgi:Holliday junction resolvase RusA-like endonuclease